MNTQLEQQRAFFMTGKTLPLEWRVEQLKSLKKALKYHEKHLLEAVKKDLGKGEFEGYITEFAMVYEELNHAIKNLPRWMEVRGADGHIAQYPGKTYLYKEPLGLVLIIAPWNYPIQLVFAPLIAAIAAGNVVAVKPSEYSVYTTMVVEQIIKETFSPEYISVYLGDKTVAQDLLKEKFDSIFFTGSTAVGKEVMRAAAEHLTPVTLELGGKSPVIVDESADLTVAAKRIMWGKCLNCGQTCIAPDYVLVDKKIAPVLIQEMHKAVATFYPGDLFTNEDYGNIINEKHYERLVSFLSQGDIAFGGQVNPLMRKIAPTVLTDVSPDSPVMQEEIFGPILPIIGYDSLEDAIQFVQKRDKPLALYLFSRDPNVKQEVLKRLSFGGGCINDTILHVVGIDYPFGGVGASGMGHYHGIFGFNAFSHEKVVLHQSNELALPVRYAPYKKKVRLVKGFIR